MIPNPRNKKRHPKKHPPKNRIKKREISGVSAYTPTKWNNEKKHAAIRIE